MHKLVKVWEKIYRCKANNMLKGLYSRRLKASNLQSKFKEQAKIEGELEWHEIEYLETCISHLLFITLG